VRQIVGEAFLIGFGGTLGVLAALIVIAGIASIGFILQLLARATLTVWRRRR